MRCSLASGVIAVSIVSVSAAPLKGEWPWTGAPAATVAAPVVASVASQVGVAVAASAPPSLSTIVGLPSVAPAPLQAVAPAQLPVQAVGQAPVQAAAQAPGSVTALPGGGYLVSPSNQPVIIYPSGVQAAARPNYWGNGPSLGILTPTTPGALNPQGIPLPLNKPAEAFFSLWGPLGWGANAVRGFLFGNPSKV